MKIKDKVFQYFKLFEQCNDIALSDIYDESIELIDWNGKWISKSEVLSANRELFKDSNISVKILDINEIDNRAYCKIQIKVNDNLLKVMDVIDFNEEGKIIKIEAYNG